MLKGGKGQGRAPANPPRPVPPGIRHLCTHPPTPPTRLPLLQLEQCLDAPGGPAIPAVSEPLRAIAEQVEHEMDNCVVSWRPRCACCAEWHSCCLSICMPCHSAQCKGCARACGCCVLTLVPLFCCGTAPPPCTRLLLTSPLPCPFPAAAPALPSAAAHAGQHGGGRTQDLHPVGPAQAACAAQVRQWPTPLPASACFAGYGPPQQQLLAITVAAANSVLGLGGAFAHLCPANCHPPIPPSAVYLTLCRHPS
jgi:hypothetical protein